jgi:hypothetical protein
LASSSEDKVTAPDSGAPQPTLRRKILSALAVAIYVAIVWWVIEWRTAPPPPPKVQMPTPAPAPTPE